MFPPQALTNDEFRKGCELIQPGGQCDLPLEAGVVVCYPLVRAGLGYVPSDFPSNGVGFDLEEFQIDPGLFLLVFTLFASGVIAINARGNGPCYEATGENQKEATCCRNPLSSMTGRWRRRRRSTGLGPLGLTVSVAAYFRSPHLVILALLFIRVRK